MFCNQIFLSLRIINMTGSQCIYKAIGRYMGIRGDTRGSGSCERCTPMYVYSPILIFRGRLLRGEYKPFKVIVSQDFMNFFFVSKHAMQSCIVRCKI